MYEKILLKLMPSEKQGKLTISAEDVPTTAPKEAIDRFMKNDENPYFKIQKIEYPIIANGMTYTKEFFRSYIDHLKERPIPGSKDGHDLRYGARPRTDLILVGAKMDDKAVYFKNYIPPKAESDNTNFINECKADLVHFSVVAYARKEYIENKDGTYTINVLDCGTEGLRNDAVSYGEGAMAQVTNADGDRMIGKSISNARKLVNAGKINTGSWSFSGSDGDKLLGPDKNDWTNYALWHMVENADAEAETKGRYKYPYGKNGEVYTQALRAIASRAGQQGLSELSDLASELYDLAKEKMKNKEGNVEPKEILDALAAKPKLALADVAAAMGEGDKIVTSKHIEAVKVVNALEEALGIKDPVTEVTAMKTKLEANAVIVRNAALDSAYGPDPEGKNHLRQYAEKMIPVSCSDIGKAIEDLKKDQIALKLAGDKADYMSDQNFIGKGDHKETPEDGITVFEG